MTPADRMVWALTILIIGFILSLGLLLIVLIDSI